MGFKVAEFLEKKNEETKKSEVRKSEVKVYYFVKYGTIFLHLQRLIPKKKLFRIVDKLKIYENTGRWELLDEDEFNYLKNKVKFKEKTFKI